MPTPLAFFSRPLSIRLVRLPAAPLALTAGLVLLSQAHGQAVPVTHPAAVFTGVQVPALSHTTDLLRQPLLAGVAPAPTAAIDRTEVLPDAPSAAASTSSSLLLATSPVAAPADPADADPSQAGHKYPKVASATDITILPGQTAPRQTVRDKLVGSVRDSVSPFSLGGEIISAGYAHVTNGSPNYGTDAKAFGQRLGASIARGTSQNLFYEGATAAILHEDPRYYEMGYGHRFLTRLFYAGTRPLITRTDGGKTTPNLALLSGYLGAAALTKVYYPQPNQGFKETMITYGGSIGGAAIGYVVSEFLSDALQIVHLKKGD